MQKAPKVVCPPEVARSALGEIGVHFEWSGRESSFVDGFANVAGQYLDTGISRLGWADSATLRVVRANFGRLRRIEMSARPN